ncbi:MAG: Crp/Fnr family transcriptional regulator [Filimonas sp.]|nr:Crp/Fnr family transcriptional regulator [Filimonas sp.]
MKKSTIDKEEKKAFNFDTLKSFFKSSVPEDPAMKIFISNLFMRTFKKGEIIKNANEEDLYLNIIVKGSAGLFVHNGRHNICITLFYEHDFLCDYLSLLKQEKTSIQLVALEHIELQSIEYSKLRKINESSITAAKIAKTVAEHLYIQKQEELIHMLTLTPVERYKKMLEERPDILRRTPLKILSSYLGVTPESLSRLRKTYYQKNSV